MNSQITLVQSLPSPRKKILFLGYGRLKTSLIDELVAANCEIWHTQEKITSTIEFDLVISFGYRHVIEKSIIESTNPPIINLHISYLPWNRGAHPNFWSFYDRTPSGVSIHIIDEGIDTGPILYQRFVNFTKEQNTFSSTYHHLIHEIELLFKENIEEIIEETFSPQPQRCAGTYHAKADLPKEFKGWDSIIHDEITRLALLLNKNQQVKHCQIAPCSPLLSHEPDRR